MTTQARPAVLLVEDEADVRDLLVTVLRSYGFEVLPAASGEEAVTLAASSDIDVLLSDIVLPQMDGFQTAVRVREFAPHAPVVFMSGYVTQAAAAGGARDAAASVLTKPFPMTVLIERIRGVLA